MINNTVFILLFIASGVGLAFLKEMPDNKKYIIKHPNGKIVKFDDIEILMEYLIRLKAINDLKINKEDTNA